MVDQSNHFAHRHIRLRAARDESNAGAVKTAIVRKGICVARDCSFTIVPVCLVSDFVNC